MSMNKVRFEVSFEKDEKAFGPGNFSRRTTTEETCYWFGEVDKLINLHESVNETIKGILSLYKKHLLSGKSSEAVFNIFGYEYNDSPSWRQNCIFRYSLYARFGTLDRAYIMTYGKEQVTYNTETQVLANFETLPRIKSYVSDAITNWIKDHVKVIEGVAV